ncbi:DUF2608 domain-containing protein [Candidatus Dependentiae bacterium]
MKFFKEALITLCLALGLFAAYYWFTTTNDVIVESNRITDIYNYIKPNEYNENLLVIFDIDNTVGKLSTELGSDQWFYAKVDNLKASGKTVDEAIQLALPELFHVQFHSWMEPVEKDTVQVIKNLQDKGVTVIALTARSLELTQRTIEQLHHMGIYFTKTDPYECPLTHGHGHGKAGLYIDGIIFSGNHSKGEMIVSWFKQIKYRPKKIIFVDDKLKNLQSVEKALHNRDYPFIGIRYGHEDELVEKFTLESVADEEAAFFAKHPFEGTVLDGAAVAH